jgi:hypothetical protein
LCLRVGMEITEIKTTLLYNPDVYDV